MSEKRDQDELDLTSPNFNPLKALENPDKVRIPCPSAPVFDNISSFIETPEGIFPKPKRESKVAKPKDPSLKAGSSKDQQSNNESEDTKDIRLLRDCKNVLTRMERTVKGPLTFLKKCMDEKLRVKVYTRGAVQVRGFCVGFIVAFDKHMNLVLKDVFETWTRKRKRKLLFLDAVSETESATEEFKDLNILSTRSEQSEKHNQRKKLNESKPKVVVRKRLKRKEICERHIDQILIRGEQIVIVTLDTNPNYQIFENEMKS
ncbi:U7 snRNA-associated Sm-like protein LSm11 [Planococcus citri]|uniref:U7 snRNA-associated Sm-like protein LSm11 n=1 Tax=Planococcus citri TaxID=170843 RepID=UPI0031F943F8